MAHPHLGQALLDQQGPEAWELLQEHPDLLLGPHLDLQQHLPMEPEQYQSVWREFTANEKMAAADMIEYFQTSVLTSAFVRSVTRDRSQNLVMTLCSRVQVTSSQY